MNFDNQGSLDGIISITGDTITTNYIQAITATIQTFNYTTATGNSLQGNTIIGNVASFNTINGAIIKYDISNNLSVGGTSTFPTNTGRNNTVMGYKSMGGGLNSGNFNFSMGDNTLFNNTTGSLNTALGASTLTNNTTGNRNTAVGYASCSQNTTGSFNVGIGDSSNFSNTGSENVAVGLNTLSSIYASNSNTAIGSNAGQAFGTNGNEGDSNTFIGAYSDSDIGTIPYTYSTAIGAYSQITGSHQIVLGTATENVIVKGSINIDGNLSSSSIYTSGTLTSSSQNVYGSINLHNTSLGSGIILNNSIAGSNNNFIKFIDPNTSWQIQQITQVGISQTPYLGIGRLYSATDLCINSNGYVGVNKVAYYTLDVNGSFGSTSINTGGINSTSITNTGGVNTYSLTTTGGGITMGSDNLTTTGTINSGAVSTGTVYCNSISLMGALTKTYSTLPSFTNQQVGYSYIDNPAPTITLSSTSTWYNLDTTTLPAGVWSVNWNAFSTPSSGNMYVKTAVSISSSSYFQGSLISSSYLISGGNNLISGSGIISLTNSTTIYLVANYVGTASSPTITGIMFQYTRIA